MYNSAATAVSVGECKMEIGDWLQITLAHTPREKDIYTGIYFSHFHSTVYLLEIFLINLMVMQIQLTTETYKPFLLLSGIN